MNTIRKKIVISAALASTVLLTACMDDAHIASRNLSKGADMFEINRRIVFFNGITDTYMLTIEGLCSITPTTNTLSVTCKTGDKHYKKHYLGLSDNVTYFVEQLDAQAVSAYRYRVIFKPASLVPNIDFRVED